MPIIHRERCHNLTFRDEADQQAFIAACSAWDGKSSTISAADVSFAVPTKSEGVRVLAVEAHPLPGRHPARPFMVGVTLNVEQMDAPEIHGLDCARTRGEPCVCHTKACSSHQHDECDCDAVTPSAQPLAAP